MASPPRLLGVVNVTEDSFSDGGRFLAPERAIEQAVKHFEAGAAAIDLGAAASHPAALPVEPEEQIRRLRPVVTELKRRGIPLSIDSPEPAVQRFALAAGVEFLNDIEGFARPEMYPDLGRSRARLIVMHSIQRRGPATRVKTEALRVLEGIFHFFSERLAALERGGVDPDRLILDPGMGLFLGSTPEPSLLALAQLARLRAEFGRPVLICVSRKSFLGAVTGRGVSERGPATLAAEIYAALEGVDYIRTHDVAALTDALAVIEAIQLGRILPSGPRSA